MEGWTYGISIRFCQAMEQAAAHPGTINEIPVFLKQASSFLYAELLGATTGVQMEIIWEIEDRNGFEAWRRLVQEMERDTLNRKLAIIRELKQTRIW